MRAILVGIGDKAIELNEEVLSSSRAIFRSGEDQKRATDVKISTFFVSEAGEVEKIPAIYSLRGPIELTREAVDFREKLPPGSYKLEIVPRSDAYMYPSVSADLRIEHDDESIEGRAEVYTKFEGGRRKRNRAAHFNSLAGDLGIPSRVLQAVPDHSIVPTLGPNKVLSPVYDNLVFHLLRTQEQI